MSDLPTKHEDTTSIQLDYDEPYQPNQNMGDRGPNKGREDQYQWEINQKANEDWLNKQKVKVKK